jgi:MFS family permease
MIAQDAPHPNLIRAPVGAGIWGRSNRWLTIGLVLTVVGAAFEALAVATTLPATIRELGGLSLYGWAFSAFMLTNLIGITVAGTEADRRGPAAPYVVGIGLFVLGLLVAGLAPSMAIVILGRTVQGFGAGVISSVAYAAIGRGYDEAAKPRMLAVLASAWVVPGLIGPGLAGLIVDHAGWRWVFLGLAPLPIIAAALALPALRLLTPDAGRAVEGSSYGAAVRLAAGAGLALAGLGVISGGPTGSAGRGYIAVAVALIAAGLALGWPALRRLLPAGTLRARPGLPATIATAGLVNMAFFGVDAFVPLALTDGRGQSATIAGLALTAATIAWTTGAWVQAQLAPRGARRGFVVAGLALIVIGIAGSAATLIPAVPVAVAPIAWGVAGLGMGLAYSTISLVVLETAPPGQEGTAASAMQLANVLATALGTGVGGVLVGAAGATGGITIQSVLMIGIAALAVVAALRMPDREPRAEN